MSDLVSTLEKRYYWDSEQSGPEVVVQQANAMDVDSEWLLETMTDPNWLEWDRWKWIKQYRLAFAQ